MSEYLLTTLTKSWDFVLTSPTIPRCTSRRWKVLDLDLHLFLRSNSSTMKEHTILLINIDANPYFNTQPSQNVISWRVRPSSRRSVEWFKLSTTVLNSRLDLSMETVVLSSATIDHGTSANAHYMWPNISSPVLKIGLKTLVRNLS